MPRQTIDRRTFIKASAAATFATPFINPGWAKASVNDKLNIAIIGTQNRGWANVAGVRHENIVAICDIDSNYLDKTAIQFPDATRFRDFRKLFDKMANDIDAVVVSTADHCHAPATASALRLGKDVYCEKPLAHTVEEARVVATLANENKLVTQMGTQIHAGENYRRVVELIQAGAIGPVHEVHVWCNKSWSDGRKKTGNPAPANIDWDLWLGPSKDQPYSEGVHPANWRRFWEWGTGTLGDMACHYMDLVHWALKLRHPTKVRTEGPEVHAVGTPKWVTVHYEHPAREEMPACKVTWYDGPGNRPELLRGLTKKDGSQLQWGDGHLFVGTKGMLISDYGRYLLLPEENFVDFTPPSPIIPRSVGHHQEWIDACKSRGTTTCNFNYSGALTEAVLLGNVAFRTGEELNWNGKNMQATNVSSAAELIHKEYRAGWTL